MASAPCYVRYSLIIQTGCENGTEKASAACCCFLRGTIKHGTAAPFRAVARSLLHLQTLTHALSQSCSVWPTTTYYGGLYEVGQAQVLVEQQVLGVRQHVVHRGQVRLDVQVYGNGKKRVVRQKQTVQSAVV